MPLVFFLLLELCLGVFKYGGELDLFVSAPEDYPQYKVCNSSVGYRYFYKLTQVPAISKQYF